MKEFGKVFMPLLAIVIVFVIILSVVIPSIKRAHERREAEGDWKEITLGGHQYFDRRSSNRSQPIHSLSCRACKTGEPAQ